MLIWGLATSFGPYKVHEQDIRSVVFRIIAGSLSFKSGLAPGACWRQPTLRSHYHLGMLFH